jgi:hypothetical protein
VVRQIMLIEKQAEYDYDSGVDYREQEREFRLKFVGAVNQALATLPEATVQINTTVDKAIVGFEMRGELHPGRLPNPGSIVASAVTRGQISSGDIGMVMGVDQSPIGPLVVVQFSAESGLVYAAMQINEFHDPSTFMPYQDDDPEYPDDYDNDDYDNYPF